MNLFSCLEIFIVNLIYIRKRLYIKKINKYINVKLNYIH